MSYYYPDWMEKARCANDEQLQTFIEETKIDPFYDLKSHEAVNFVKNYCRLCPVNMQCLNYALESDEHGSWGGLTEKGRKRLVRSLDKRFSTLQTTLQELLRDA